MSYAKQIAEDLIAEMARRGPPGLGRAHCRPSSIACTCRTWRTWRRGRGHDRNASRYRAGRTQVGACGWGAARITITLGILFDVAVTTADGVVTDPNIDAYEALIDQFCTWLIGPRKFATYFSASEPTAVFGDHYNDHLYEKSEFHVPVLVDFFCDVGVT